jgi:hypothetical protein
MPITHPAQHKYNTKTVQIHKNKTLNIQNNNSMSGEKEKKYCDKNTFILKNIDKLT